MPKYRVIISTDSYVSYEDVEEYVSELLTGLTIDWEDVHILGFGEDSDDIAHRFASNNMIKVKDFYVDVEQYGLIDAYQIRFNKMLEYATEDDCSGLLFTFYKKYDNPKEEAERAAKAYGLNVFSIGV